MSRQYKEMKSNSSDQFQTPGCALDPLLKHVPEVWTIWEPACGKGNLVEYLYHKGRDVFGTDILDCGRDFLLHDAPVNYGKWDMTITNPPYSIKDKWIQRCYDLGKPFALLLPVTILASYERQMMFKKYGAEFITIPRRINFETPNTVAMGKKSSAWFASLWVTWGLNIGRQITYTEKT